MSPGQEAPENHIPFSETESDDFDTPKGRDSLLFQINFPNTRLSRLPNNLRGTERAIATLIGPANGGPENSSDPP